MRRKGEAFRRWEVKNLNYGPIVVYYFAATRNNRVYPGRPRSTTSKQGPPRTNSFVDNKRDVAISLLLISLWFLMLWKVGLFLWKVGWFSF